MQSHQVLNDYECRRPFEITQVYYELSFSSKYNLHCSKGCCLLRKQNKNNKENMRADYLTR